MIILSIYTTFVEHRTAIRSAARATMVSPFWTQSADLPKSSLSDVSEPLLWPLSFHCHPRWKAWRDLQDLHVCLHTSPPRRPKQISEHLFKRLLLIFFSEISDLL